MKCCATGCCRNRMGAFKLGKNNSLYKEIGARDVFYLQGCINSSLLKPNED